MISMTPSCAKYEHYQYLAARPNASSCDTAELMAGKPRQRQAGHGLSPKREAALIHLEQG